MTVKLARQLLFLLVIVWSFWIGLMVSPMRNSRVTKTVTRTVQHCDTPLTRQERACQRICDRQFGVRKITVDEPNGRSTCECR